MSSDQTSVLATHAVSFGGPGQDATQVVDSVLPVRNRDAMPKDTWMLRARFADRVVYQGQQFATGRNAIRVVFAADRFEASDLSELKQRCRLIELLDSPHVLSVLEHQLRASPPFVVTADPHDWHPLTSTKLTPNDRMSLSGELLDTTRRAHRLGLVHGRLHPSRVFVVRSALKSYSLRLDFLDVANDALRPSGRTVDCDLAGLAVTLNELLLPIVDDPVAVAGRQRAVLKKRLAEALDEPLDLQQWVDTLRPWLPKDDSVTFAGDQLAHLQRDTDEDRTGILLSDSCGNRPSAAEANIDMKPFAAAQLGTLQPGDLLGRFKIDSHLGIGGMGSVYKAIDVADDRVVALKVLRSEYVDMVKAIRRFQKEARLLAEIENEYVTRLIHIGEDRGAHFMAMEFIDGMNLKEWLRGRLPLDETLAVSIVADVARALVDAHEKTIVHRDIKPENVLVQFASLPRKSLEGPAQQDHEVSDRPRIKLSDFGIARHVQQSASLEVTRAGSMLGTPRYMSPEQCKGNQEITPAADVYSLGVMLFELLAGEPPFQSDDPMRLAAMHCFESPPTVRSRGIQCSDAAERVLAAALAKEPEKRFIDARDMLRELQRVLHGETADFEAHPRLPANASATIWKKTKTWELQSSPEHVWPFVSNTERLNRAIGLPPVDYEMEHDPQLGLRRWGSFRLGGVSIRWEEHPFEWIERQRMGILREFESGPFRWFMSIVSLQPKGNGTLLSHEVRVEPRNLIGRALTKIEADWKGFRNLDRVYRRIDRMIQGKLKPAEGGDAFETPPKPRQSIEKRLGRRIDRMIASGVDPMIAEKLADFLKRSPPQPLSRIRPLELADTLRVEADSMLDTCLIAASEGLLELRWEVLCPTCRVSADSFDLLSDIQSHTRCEACNVNFQSNIAEQIELVFRPHAEIRSVEDAVYCIGGPEHSPHVVAQVRIDAAERMELDLSLDVGDYLLRSTRLPRTQTFHVASSGAPGQFESQLTQFGRNSFVPTVRAGRQQIILCNDDASLHVVKVERSIDRSRCVTAAMAMALPNFRKRFPAQTFSVDNPISTRQVTLLTSAINNLDQIHQTLGDTEAYILLQKFHASLCEVVSATGGTIVKTSAEGSVAVFRQCNDSVCAAFELQRHVQTKAELQPLQVGIGVHRGDALVATLNGTSDYFGVHVRAATALPRITDRSVLLTETVFADPVVAASFAQQLTSVPVTLVDLPGLPNTRVQSFALSETNDV